MLHCFRRVEIKRILDQYHKWPLPLKASIWFTISLFLQKGISLLTSPIVARILSTEEYGRINLFISWESVFMNFVTLSSDHAILKLCVKYEDKDKILSSIIGYNLFIAAIWGIILFFATPLVLKVTGLSYILVICLFFHCLFTIQIFCWSYIRQYEYVYKIVVFETLLCTFCASFGSLLALIFLGKTAETKIIFQILPLAIIGFIITLKALGTGKAFYDANVWKFTLFFCVPLIPHFFSEKILMNSDRIMIDKMCGTSNVAVYSVAYSVGTLITLLTSAINSAFAPYQFQKIKTGEYKKLAKNANYVIGFVALCLCGIMLFSQEIIWFFGGEKYLESVSIVIPISLGLFFNYMFQLFGRVQEYFEQRYTIVIASICCAMLNIVLNSIFIRQYGYQAAAYTTLFCYFVFCFLHYIFYKIACKKYVGCEIYDIKGLIIISVVLIVVSIGIYFINRILYLKYVLFITMLILMIIKRNMIISIVKMIIEKDKKHEYI